MDCFIGIEEYVSYRLKAVQKENCKITELQWNKKQEPKMFFICYGCMCVSCCEGIYHWARE